MVPSRRATHHQRQHFADPARRKSRRKRPEPQLSAQAASKTWNELRKSRASATGHLPNSSTVVVDLQDQIQYEAHTLDNPPRVYFDLQDTKMASGLLNQSISVDDSFLKRVRMAQPKCGRDPGGA